MGSLDDPEQRVAALSALRGTQLDHYAEHKADVVEIKSGLASIVTLLGRLGGGPSSGSPD